MRCVISRTQHTCLYCVQCGHSPCMKRPQDHLTCVEKGHVCGCKYTAHSSPLSLFGTQVLRVPRTRLKPQRPASGAGRSSASGPPLAARLSPHLALFVWQLRPFHQGCSSKCTKARDGCKRRRELSWRQLEQRAGRHDSRASASAPTAAADGRKVLSDDRGAPSVV